MAGPILLQEAFMLKKNLPYWVASAGSLKFRDRTPLDRSRRKEKKRRKKGRKKKDKKVGIYLVALTEA